MGPPFYWTAGVSVREKAAAAESYNACNARACVSVFIVYLFFFFNIVLLLVRDTRRARYSLVRVRLVSSLLRLYYNVWKRISRHLARTRFRLVSSRSTALTSGPAHPALPRTRSVRYLYLSSTK